MAAPLKPTRPSTAAWPTAGARPVPGKPGAGASTVAEETNHEKYPPSAAVQALRRSSHSGDMLGVAWVHGALHVAAFRRQSVTGQWEAPGTVRTIEEFAAGLDEAIVQLKFTGTEI